MRRVFVLGCTGTIGINTLQVVERYPERFRVIGLTAFNNLDLLEQQVEKFSPAYVGISRDKYALLKNKLSGGAAEIFDVETALADMVARPDVDVVVIGMSGRAALEPFLSAVRAGKTVAPANKEALVIAGEIIMREARAQGAAVIPVDSEQSAIFQCLRGEQRPQLDKVFLTASGGPLRTVPRSRFSRLTVSDILKHPRWRMGKKITVDSATMMNKGFEIIEAQRLFNLSVEDIEVIVHPEAIVHSMVAYQDGSVIAQMGIPDMRIPIQYALSYPDRMPTGLKPLDLVAVKQLTFLKPDPAKFPSLGLALNVARQGGTMPAVLNAADEVAVEAFLSGAVPFDRIYRIVEKVVANHTLRRAPGLEEIRLADLWAREEAHKVIQALPSKKI